MYKTLHMKNLRIIYLLCFLFITVFVSCEDNELDPSYKGDSRIVLSGDAEQGARQDSILFSFATYEENVQETQIRIFAQTMGNLPPMTRTLRIEADPDSTTALPDEYDFPETITVASGAIQLTIPVTIKRTQRLKVQDTKVVLRVVSNEDFLPGPRVPARPGGVVNSGPSFHIVWNDQLTKPAFWDPVGTQSLRTVWGDWSQVKHQLIVDLTGIRDFSELSTAQKYYIQGVALAHLAAHNAAYPDDPIQNEFDQVIGFCGTCN